MEDAFVDSFLACFVFTFVTTEQEQEQESLFVFRP